VIDTDNSRIRVVQDSCPRIVCLGENPGCPCGGTHVSDISEIGEVKVGEFRSLVVLYQNLKSVDFQQVHLSRN
jgi:Ser-tRNA(Ala) deacylase AlaX